MCFAVAETGEGREEGLFVVQIDLGSPLASVVEIGRIAVGSPAAETEIQMVVAHNQLAVKETQKYRGLLLAEMPKNRGVVRGNQWAEEEFLWQNRAVSEGCTRSAA